MANDDDNFDYDDLMLDEEHLQQLLPNLISSLNPHDKDILDDIIVKIMDHKDRDAFRCLLECGYKMEILNGKEETAIHLARENNFLKSFYPVPSDRELLENSIGKVNYADPKGLSLLHIACEIGCENAVKNFLENKVEVNDPYLYEVYSDEEDEIHSNENGFTPLHFAVKNVQVDIVKLLLDHGANVNAEDLLSRTPLHIAMQFCVSLEYPTGDLDIMELLVKNKSSINAKDSLGNTPLLAIFGDFARFHWVWNKRREKQMKKLDILLSNGADITQTNNNGDTVLHCIIKDLKPVLGSVCDRVFYKDSHQVELITKVLTSSNIDMNAKNKQGKSPLDLAISHLSSPIVAVLLQHKADFSSVKFTDEKSYFECRRVAPNYYQVLNLTTIVELLIQHGFEITFEDNLAILKFLVHNFDDCDCWNRHLHENNMLRDNVTNLLDCGSAEHISQVFKRLISWGQRESYEHYIDVISDIATCYLKSLQYNELFVHRQIEQEINNYILVNDYTMTSYRRWYPQFKVEIEQMKSTILKDKISFYDIMVMHPYRIYWLIKNVDIDWESIDETFVFYSSVMKGHMSRSVVRKYVEILFFDQLKAEYFPFLSDDLCKEIINYLSNEDILNMYLTLRTTGDK